WGYSVFVAMFVVAVIAPFLGAIADYSGSKKKFLLFFTSQAVIFTGLLFFVMKGSVAAGMIFFILAEIGYRAAQVFYNGFLPEIASTEDMGRIAGAGWAIGSAGGVVCLIIVLAMIMGSGGSNLMVRLSFVFTAVFFALSALPLFLWLPERAESRKLPEGENYWSIAIKQLKDTISTAASFKEFLKFMLAFLIYNDGVIMALDFAAILGGVLFGLDQQGLIVLMILVQITNVIGAYLFGMMVDRFDGKRTLIFSILLLIADVIYLYFAQTITEYFVIAAIAGFAMAGVQSVSRTMVGMFSPPGRSAEFYGFFALTGRTSSFIGPAIFGWLAAMMTARYLGLGMDSTLAEQGGHRAAVLSIVVFLFIGLLLLLWVNEKKAVEAAQE
ncbi:MAG TPA: MFS transporter, partial [Caldilineae bacterium]|nr:MFS transporter [Caldilineae bacterium]